MIENNLLYLQYSTDYGYKRRDRIRQWFIDNPDGAIAINRKWQTQLKFDPDLRKLIKSGFLKQYRRNWCHNKHKMGWKRSGSSQTYLIRAK